MAATRIVVQLPPTYSEEVPVKWYGAPSVAEIEGACRAAIGAKLQSLEDSDPLMLVDEDGDTVVLSHTLPNGLKLRLQLPDPAPTPRAREVDLPLSEKKSKKEKKEKKEKKNEKKRKSENEKEPPAQPKPVHAVLEQTSAPSAAAPAPSAWSQIGQAAASSRAAPSPTESGGKRRRRERKDWACPKCGTLCFEKKVTCFKCGTAKP